MEDSPKMANVYIQTHTTVPSSLACRWILDAFRHCTSICNAHGFNLALIDEVYAEDSAAWSSLALEVHGDNAFEVIQAEMPAPDPEVSTHLVIDIYPELSVHEDFTIPDSDLMVEYYRREAYSKVIAQAESNVRLTHFPTNIVVRYQSDRSRVKNYDAALRMLKSKIVARTKSAQSLNSAFDTDMLAARRSI